MQPDVRQEYSEALAMCKQAAAEAAEENNVKRSQNIKATAIVVVLMLIVVLGIRRAIRPVKAGPVYVELPQEGERPRVATSYPLTNQPSPDEREEPRLPRNTEIIEAAGREGTVLEKGEVEKGEKSEKSEKLASDDTPAIPERPKEEVIEAG